MINLKTIQVLSLFFYLFIFGIVAAGAASMVKTNVKDEGIVADHTLGLPRGFVKKYRLRYWAQSDKNRIPDFIVNSIDEALKIADDEVTE